MNKQLNTNMKKNKEVIVQVETATIPDKEVLRAKLKGLITDIDEKLAKLGVGQAAVPFKTGSASFRMNEGDSNGVTLPAQIDLAYLIKALSRVREVKSNFLAEVERLGLTTTPILNWNGINIDNWIYDLEMRINQIANAKQVQDLKDSKVKLEAFLSEEDRLIKTLGDVSGLLGIKQNLLG